jgi:urease accessory protein UreF
MATSTYLSNPGVMINSVDLTDQCTSATVTNRSSALESTAFGSTSRVYTAGLYDQEITLEFYMSYAATETYATLAALVGTTTTVKVSNTVAGLTTATATSPRFELVGTFLEELPVINATMGELSTISVTFKGGVLTTVVA